MSETKPHSLCVCVSLFEKSNKFMSTEKGENLVLAFYNLFAFVGVVEIGALNAYQHRTKIKLQRNL